MTRAMMHHRHPTITQQTKQAAAASFLMSRGARADIPVGSLGGTPYSHSTPSHQPTNTHTPTPPHTPQDEASGLLPLHLAAVEGHIPTMEVLLGLPPSPPVVPRRFDAIVPPSPYLAPAARTATGVTPLHLGMALVHLVTHTHTVDIREHESQLTNPHPLDSGPQQPPRRRHPPPRAPPRPAATAAPAAARVSDSGGAGGWDGGRHFCWPCFRPCCSCGGGG